MSYRSYYLPEIRSYFYIHIEHDHWFDEYNYHISKEDKHTTGSLILQKDPESILHHSDLLNLIPCELDITSTPFIDTSILKYEIKLPHYGKKLCFVCWVMIIFPRRA